MKCHYIDHAFIAMNAWFAIGVIHIFSDAFINSRKRDFGIDLWTI